MTANAFELMAEVRHDMGKGASRRLRRLQDKVPGILYGGGEDPLPLAFDHKKLLHTLENQVVYSHILILNISGKKQQVILKDLQRHHFKKAIFHLDLLRVKATDHITMHVPLHFVGEAKCPGVKAGGVVSHRLMDVEVRCLASQLPESIEVDLSEMGLDQILHLSQLKLPKGVELVALAHGQGPEHDHAVVSIHTPRAIEESTPTAEPQETEVPAKGKEKESKAAEKSNMGASASHQEKNKGK